MALIYVTGISGSGKSAIRDELGKRGYPAYDLDEGFKGWYNKKTDTRSKKEKPWEDSPSLSRSLYRMKIERAKVEELAVRAKNETIFLCGGGPNDTDMRDLFDKVIHLSITEKTLRERLAIRANNYGKHPDDLKDILQWHKEIDEHTAGLGAVIVNAEQTLDKVADEILRIAGLPPVMSGAKEPE